MYESVKDNTVKSVLIHVWSAKCVTYQMKCDMWLFKSFQISEIITKILFDI